MSLYEILPWPAALGFLVFGIATASGRVHGRSWLVPASLSALLLGWSLWAIAQRGLAGVWAELTRNAWGAQIWFDLLLSVGLALNLLLPRARAVGMRPLPWFALVACTGSVGLLAMMARSLFLEDRADRQAV